MCGLTTAKTPCFGAPIINCGGTPLVCPAFAGTCRGAMLFEIICLKILSMQPKTRYGLQFRTLAFASTQVHFLGRVRALSIQRQNRRKSTEAKLILIPKERVIRLWNHRQYQTSLKTCGIVTYVSLAHWLIRPAGLPNYTYLLPNLRSLGEGFRDCNLTREASEIASGFYEALKLRLLPRVN